MQWSARVETVLYGGETVESRFDIDGRVLVFTSHRVLAFTPDDGRTYASVDRPRVTGVSVSSGGDRRHLWRAVRSGLVGVGLLAVASAVSLRDVVPPLETANVDTGTPGVAGVAGAIETVRSMLALLDLAILGGGLVLAGAAVVLVGLYVRSRTRELVVEVEGATDVTVPLETDDEELVADVRSAVRPAPGDADPPGE